MEELLRQIDTRLGDLLAVYKLLHSVEIEDAKARVLGDGTRKKIYDLCDGQTGVTEIAKALKVAQPTVSNHISVLLDSGLVNANSMNGHKFYIKRLER